MSKTVRNSIVEPVCRIQVLKRALRTRLHQVVGDHHVHHNMLLIPIKPATSSHHRPATVVAKPSDGANEMLLEIQQVLSQLSPKELEETAQMSHRYRSGSQRGFQAQIQVVATWLARTLVTGYGGTSGDTLLSFLRQTLHFRREINMPQLLSAFEAHGGNSETRRLLREHMLAQNVYVQGYDRQGRSTLVFVPRKTQQHDTKWTLRQHVWNLEKALACSRAPDGSMNAMIDCKGIGPKQAPPTAIGHAVLQTFTSQYAPHVHAIFLVDAPATFLCLWTLCKPLLSKATKRKIHFVNSRARQLDQWYTSAQAAPWMLPGGQLANELNDVDAYLRLPFDRPYV